MKKTVMVTLDELIPYFLETVQGTETVFMKDDLEACPEVKQNQTYEDWLNELKKMVIREERESCSIEQFRDNTLIIITMQANFIWKKLCDKDDQIIKLERKLANATRILLQMKGETDE